MHTSVQANFRTILGMHDFAESRSFVPRVHSDAAALAYRATCRQLVAAGDRNDCRIFMACDSDERRVYRSLLQLCMSKD